MDNYPLKRVRQACVNRRRRKTKCSGEQPVCRDCRRTKRTCVYEPYSATLAAGPGCSPVAELLHRIHTIESRLAELTGERLPSNFDSSIETSGFSTAPISNPSPPSPASSSTPEFSVAQSLIDTYFVRVHNQPYSCFDEASIRRRFLEGNLPRYLLLAIISSAIRFSDLGHFAAKSAEASNKWAKESWSILLSDRLHMEDQLDLSVVQKLIILTLVDYTAGRVSAGWLKIGLAARVLQDLQLMNEPASSLSAVDAEEQRRTVWSAYLLDRLISCGRSRPLAILDQDCKLQLPCHEEELQTLSNRATDRPGGRTLEKLLSWNTEIETKPSLLALVILVASILGRCTRYVTQKPESDSDKAPPWALDSEVSSINSSLLLWESHSGFGNKPLAAAMADCIQQPSGVLDRQQVGLLVFGKMLFHLCHCLVNHPFIIRVRLRPFATKVPVSFSLRLLQVGREHACQLLDTVREAREAGYEIESSFTAYSIAVAGGIHSIGAHHEQRQAAAQGHHTQEDSVGLRYYKESVRTLDRLAEYWVLASNTAIRLREFHQQSAAFIDLLDPTALHEGIDPSTSQILWTVIDYRTLGERSPKNTPSIGSAPDAQQLDWNTDPSLSMPIFPSADSNVLAGGASDQLLSFEEADLRILTTGVVTPAAQLDEIDHLLGTSRTRYTEMLF